MALYSFASAFSSVPLTAPPYPNFQAGVNIRAATGSTSKYTERSGNLSTFLCHVLYLEKRLQEEENLDSFIDDKVDRVISRAKLGEGLQFTVYSVQANFKQPMRHLKAHESGQFIAVKVLKPNVDEE
jgi:hypothetical protein